MSGLVSLFVVGGLFASSGNVAVSLLVAQAPLDLVDAASPGGEKYDGVSPGPGSKNPLPGAKPQPPHLIWSGFQMTDNGSRVFFQLNRAVTFEVKSTEGKGKRPGTMSVFLRNCRIHLKNNRRKLDTRYFSTPVRDVTIYPRRKDVELRIVLKEPATSVPRLEEGADGTQFLVLDFPFGKADEPAIAPAKSEGATDIESSAGEPAESSLK